MLEINAEEMYDSSFGLAAYLLCSATFHTTKNTILIESPWEELYHQESIINSR